MHKIKRSLTGRPVKYKLLTTSLFWMSDLKDPCCHDARQAVLPAPLVASAAHCQAGSSVEAAGAPWGQVYFSELGHHLPQELHQALKKVTKTTRKNRRSDH